MAKKKLTNKMVSAVEGDSPLVETNKKKKNVYDRISLATSPVQKKKLEEKKEAAGESSLSRFILKELEKYGMFK